MNIRDILDVCNSPKDLYAPYSLINKSSIETIDGKNYNRIILSSGSSKGYVHLGALYYLFTIYPKLFNYTSMKLFAGSSIGSVISLLLSIGMKPIEIYSKFVKINMEISIEKVPNTFGMLKTDIFSNIEKIMISKYGFIPTLKQLYDITGKIFICTAYNLSKHKGEYFDYLSFPDLSSIKAIEMSCNIPLLFGKMEYNGNLYIDGAFFDKCPIKYVYDTFGNGENTLSIIFNPISPSIKNLSDYIYQVLTIPLHSQQDKTLEYSYFNNTIFQICMKDTLFYDIFGATQNKYKFEMFKIGIDGIKKAKCIKKKRE